MSRTSAVSQQGFTLIEILLVIVIMVVLSAMVAPSFFQATGASINSEARYMQKLLRLTAEEAQLTGKLVRCSVYRDRLQFESPNAKGVWQVLRGDLFQAGVPQARVIVRRAHLNGDVSLANEHLQDGEKPALARFTFWPDGRVSRGELELFIEGETDSRVITLGSGPGGIHVLDVSK